MNLDLAAQKVHEKQQLRQFQLLRGRFERLAGLDLVDGNTVVRSVTTAQVAETGGCL